MNHSRNTDRPHRLHRDSERAVILGVCAGIAEYFDWPLWLTRAGAFALGWFFPVHIVVVYGVAALLISERPLRYMGDGDERSFWESRRGGS